MLSIIISSYQPEFFNALEKNIAETCGVPYEIIKVENPNIMGICEAYNIGAEKARFQNLLFLHEDVLFETKNWGEKLVNKLSEDSTGILGVAGGNYVPNVPFAWWDSPKTYKNLNQYHGAILSEKLSISEDSACITLDGVFLACRFLVWKKYKFESAIKGFHGYDIDFSSRVANDLRNWVISDIAINHYSYGNADSSWIDNLVDYRPLFKAPLWQKKNKVYENQFFLIFLKYLRKSNRPILQKIKILIKYNNPLFLGWSNFTFNFFKINIFVLLEIRRLFANYYKAL